MKKWLGFFLLGALVACASDEPVETSSEEVAPPPVAVRTDHLICPQVAIIREAEEIADYGGKEAVKTNLVAKARLRRLVGDCAYRSELDDPDEPTGVDLSFTLDAAALRGEAMTGEKAFFPYFVAVVDPLDTIVRREKMDLAFRFSDDKLLIEKTERLHVFIPLPPEALLQGPTYRVLIGFIKPAASAKTKVDSHSSKSSDDR